MGCEVVMTTKKRLCLLLYCRPPYRVSEKQTEMEVSCGGSRECATGGRVCVCVRGGGTSTLPFSRGRSRDFVTLAIHKDLLGLPQSQSPPKTSGAANKIRKAVHREGVSAQSSAMT